MCVHTCTHVSFSLVNSREIIKGGEPLKMTGIGVIGENLGNTGQDFVHPFLSIRDRVCSKQ
jgi:hypothetical protein